MSILLISRPLRSKWLHSLLPGMSAAAILMVDLLSSSSCPPKHSQIDLVILMLIFLAEERVIFVLYTLVNEAFTPYFRPSKMLDLSIEEFYPN